MAIDVPGRPPMAGAIKSIDATYDVPDLTPDDWDAPILAGGSWSGPITKMEMSGATLARFHAAQAAYAARMAEAGWLSAEPDGSLGIHVSEAQVERWRWEAIDGGLDQEDVIRMHLALGFDVVGKDGATLLRVTRTPVAARAGDGDNAGAGDAPRGRAHMVGLPPLGAPERREGDG